MELDRKPRLIDGGLATELADTFGHKNIDGDPLWSARLIATHPKDVALAHQNYLEAGCDIIETVTYQASIAGLEKHLSVDFSKAVDIIGQGVKICIQARDEFWEKRKQKVGLKPLVAGSIGPYGAHLSDGSEYKGLYVDKLSEQELVEWHRAQIQTIWRCGVDIIAFETIPSIKEAKAIIRTLREFPDAKAWISFSCENDKLTCHGEPFGDAMKVLASSKQIIGGGVNCTAPWFVEPLLASIPKSLLETQNIIAYPNSGQFRMPDNRWSEADASKSRAINEYVDIWMTHGATWIGGCCNVTPKDIALMRTAIDKRCK